MLIVPHNFSAQHIETHMRLSRQTDRKKENEQLISLLFPRHRNANATLFASRVGQIGQSISGYIPIGHNSIRNAFRSINFYCFVRIVFARNSNRIVMHLTNGGMRSRTRCLTFKP